MKLYADIKLQADGQEGSIEIEDFFIDYGMETEGYVIKDFNSKLHVADILKDIKEYINKAEKAILLISTKSRREEEDIYDICTEQADAAVTLFTDYKRLVILERIFESLYNKLIN